jgi:prepilin-type N-terminal cleavage/methylation domain-containing protein
MLRSIHTRRAPRRAFTLLELVIVVAILVILAGYVLGKLDVLDMKANKGVAASNMGGVSRYLQLFRVNSTQYPDGWDSLTDGTNLWATTTPNTKCLDPQLLGALGPVPGSPHKLTITTIGAGLDGETRSLTRMGIHTLYDVDTALPVGAPGDAFGNNDGTTPGLTRQIGPGSVVATLNVADQHAAPGAGDDGDAIGIFRHVYPTNDPTSPLVPNPNKRLVVFGFGRLNTCIGNTQGALLNEAPFYANTNQALYYNRFLCVFEVDAGGSRAKLAAVLGSDGDRIDEEIADYYEQE